MKAESIPPENCTISSFHFNIQKYKLLDGVDFLYSVLSAPEIEHIIANFFLTDLEKWHSVGVQGTVPTEQIGSTRINRWSPDFAKFLEDKILQSCKPIIGTGNVLTDWYQSKNGADYEGREWIPNSVSPLFRCMRYKNGGQHWPHYDAGYIYPNEKFRTLKSFVLYLSTHKSGYTRFINDGQLMHIKERNHNDWSRQALQSEVVQEYIPNSGSILLFNHRICHDVSAFHDSNDRLIIRGDIVYKLKD